MNTDPTTNLDRRAAINGLAVVGFIALVAAGVWFAIYSTRFVPTVVNRLGTAAVYVGSVFNRPSGSTLSVVPTPSASTTIPFGPATSSADVAASVNTNSTSATKPAAAATGGEKKSGTYPIGGTTSTGVLSGLPDLTVTISTTGYLTTASTDSFVASSSVPAGDRPAIRFTIKNIGTNWTGTWRFSASIPTFTAYVFTSDPQQSLAPGDSIDYTLGFDQAISGANQPISITVNSDNAVTESNTSNNTASTKLTVLGF